MVFQSPLYVAIAFLVICTGLTFGKHFCAAAFNSLQSCSLSSKPSLLFISSLFVDDGHFCYTRPLVLFPSPPLFEVRFEELYQ